MNYGNKRIPKITVDDSSVVQSIEIHKLKEVIYKEYSSFVHSIEIFKVKEVIYKEYSSFVHSIEICT